MRSGVVRVAVYAIGLSAGLWRLADGAKIKLEAGVGYDFISQEFFLDSITRSAGDSLDFALKTDYLDDVKGRLVLSISPHKDSRFKLTSIYEQTPDFIRTRMVADAGAGLGSARLDVNGEFDWKSRYAVSSTEAADGYRYGYLRSRLSVPVSTSLKARFQMTGEAVGFDSVTGFNYDYYRVGGKVGLTKSFEDFSFADFNLFAGTRQVSDSTRLNYLVWGAEASYLGSWGPAEMDLAARFERKNYNQPGGEDDHFLFEFEGANKLRLGDNYFSRQELDLDLTFYNPDDPFNRSYGRVGAAVLAGYEAGGLAVAIGPHFESLFVRQADSVSGEDYEDYFEGGARVDLDLNSADRFFGSVESVLGYRDLTYENTLQSNFTFERLSLIGDLKVWGGLSFNVLFSAEWEWHKSETENARIFLLSSSLNYTF